MKAIIIMLAVCAVCACSNTPSKSEPNVKVPQTGVDPKDTQVDVQIQRVVNSETNAACLFGKLCKFSSTPVYKNQYEITLLKPGYDCDDRDLTDAGKLILPPNTYFRETSNHESQTDQARVVHIYELDTQKNNPDKTKKLFFSAPMTLCLDGYHKVSKDRYQLRGGFDKGILVVPFKVRGKDLYGDATVGPYVAYRFETTEFLATAGLTQVSISEIGTDDVTSETGLTMGVGWVWSLDTDWDVAIIAGKDWLAGDSGDRWQHQGDWWFSFGIGFNFGQ